MSRVLVRRASVMIVIAALALVALPTAEARPLAEPHATSGVGASWISALSTWVSSFFPGTPKTAPTSHRTTASTTTITGTMHTMTGSCIDPNGHPIPCNPGS